MEYSIRINKQLYRSVPLLLRIFGRDYLQTPIHRPGGFPFWQLLIGVSGVGECKVEGKRCLLHPGEVLLLPPGLAHSYQSASSEDWIVHYAGFTGNSCQKLLVDMQFFKPGIYHIKDQELCTTYMDAFTRIMEDNPPNRNRMLSKELYSFLLDISRESSYVEMSAEVRENHLVSDILLYLEEHYAQDISLREIAEHTGKRPNTCAPVSAKRPVKPSCML